MKVTSATHHTTQRGGQASVGTFGYASFLAPAVPVPVSAGSRRVDGLTFGQRRARLRAGVQAAYIAHRKGQVHDAPSQPEPQAEVSPVEVAPASVADQVAAVYARLDKVGNPPLRRTYDPAWNDAQYQEWLDEVHADNVAWQAKLADLAADEDEGDSSVRPPSTPARSVLPPTRIKGALNSSDRDGLSAAHYRRPPTSTPAHFPGLADEPELAHRRWLADLAEAHGCPFDEEAAVYARSFAGAGHAEHLMALEG